MFEIPACGGLRTNIDFPASYGSMVAYFPVMVLTLLGKGCIVLFITTIQAWPFNIWLPDTDLTRLLKCNVLFQYSSTMGKLFEQKLMQKRAGKDKKVKTMPSEYCHVSSHVRVAKNALQCNEKVIERYLSQRLIFLLFFKLDSIRFYGHFLPVCFFFLV